MSDEVTRQMREQRKEIAENLQAQLETALRERDHWKVEAATRFNQIAGLNTKVNELKEEISHLRGLRRQNDAVIKELRMLVVAGLKG
jgi:polyhydroxyalkanoate synthesis regulator phasin